MLPEYMRDEYESIFFKENDEKKLWKFVKAADKLSAYIKCIEEDNAGNREFKSAKESLWQIINDIEMPEVKEFINEFLPAYGRTLDELVAPEGRKGLGVGVPGEIRAQEKSLTHEVVSSLSLEETSRFHESFHQGCALRDMKLGQCILYRTEILVGGPSVCAPLWVALACRVRWCLPIRAALPIGLRDKGELCLPSEVPLLLGTDWKG